MRSADIAFAITNSPAGFIGALVLVTVALTLLFMAIVRNMNLYAAKDSREYAEAFPLVTHLDRGLDHLPEALQVEMNRGFYVPLPKGAKYVYAMDWEKENRS